MWAAVRIMRYICVPYPASAAMDATLQACHYATAARFRKLTRRSTQIVCARYGTGAKTGAVLLVESPAKARKIQGFLGDEYKVLSSYGHVRDLPSKQGAVVPADGFAMHWELLGDAKTRVRELAEEVKGANKLILATDPDREGEAISWHVLQELQARDALNGVVVERITFTEVTQSAIKHALQQPRSVSTSLVDAYLARRALDYLVGFNMSPVLWRKLPGSKSAGRVQSVALRLICQREDEVDRFVSQEYWSVTARLLTETGDSFEAELTHFGGKKLGKMGLHRELALKAAERIQAALFQVKDVTAKESQRSPSPPFITSTMQIEASRRLGMSTQRTMSAAQSLYEGSTGGEGLITYMRTDGLHTAPSAVSDIRSVIINEFGSFFVPPTPRLYKSKSANAQEAHEAIRPTKMSITPKMLEGRLPRDEARLYTLIWTRAAASQMSPAKLKQVAAVLESETGDVTLRASGSQVIFPGYLQAYDDNEVLSDGIAQDPSTEQSTAASAQKANTAKKLESSNMNKLLADLKVGNKVSVREVLPEQHHTKPPGRFSEGSLVKELESLGIGRPSTYASIIRVLLQRGYVDKTGQSLKPSAKGRVVTGFLVEYFTRYMDYDFTAYMESQLDEISASRVDWLAVMSDFWGPFNTSVEEALGQRNSLVYSHLDKALEHLLYPPSVDGSDPRKCPACGAPLHLKVGKSGPFVGCTNYAKKGGVGEEEKGCTYARPIGEDPLGNVAEGTSDSNGAGGSLTNGRQLGPHPVTGELISVRNGPFGPYLQVGEVTETNQRPRRVTIKGMKDLSSLTLEAAVSLLGEERVIGPHPEDNLPITSGTGQYGPYVSHSGIFAALRKGQDVDTVTLEAAVQLLAAKRERMQAKAEAAGKKSTGKKSGKAVKVVQSKGKKRAAGGAEVDGDVKKSKSTKRSKSSVGSKSKSTKESDTESDSGDATAGSIAVGADSAAFGSDSRSVSKSKGKAAADAAAAGADSAADKPVSGYVLWMREEKAKVVREQPDLTPAAVLKTVREGWKTLDAAVKEQYKQKAAVQHALSAAVVLPSSSITSRTAETRDSQMLNSPPHDSKTQDPLAHDSETLDSPTQILKTVDSPSQVSKRVRSPSRARKAADSSTQDSQSHESNSSGSGQDPANKKPGKGLLAYALFVREEKERQIEADPEVKPGEAVKRAREAWKTLDTATKEQYTLRALAPAYNPAGIEHTTPQPANTPAASTHKQADTGIGTGPATGIGLDASRHTVSSTSLEVSTATREPNTSTHALLETPSSASLQINTATPEPNNLAHVLSDASSSTFEQMHPTTSAPLKTPSTSTEHMDPASVDVKASNSTLLETPRRGRPRKKNQPKAASSAAETVVAVPDTAETMAAGTATTSATSKSTPAAPATAETVAAGTATTSTTSKSTPAAPATAETVAAGTAATSAPSTTEPATSATAETVAGGAATTTASSLMEVAAPATAKMVAAGNSPDASPPSKTAPAPPRLPEPAPQNPGGIQQGRRAAKGVRKPRTQVGALGAESSAVKQQGQEPKGKGSNSGQPPLASFNPFVERQNVDAAGATVALRPDGLKLAAKAGKGAPGGNTGKPGPATQPVGLEVSNKVDGMLDAQAAVVANGKAAVLPDAQADLVLEVKAAVLPDATADVAPEAQAAVLPDAKVVVLLEANAAELPDANTGAVPAKRQTGSVANAKANAPPDGAAADPTSSNSDGGSSHRIVEDESAGATSAAATADVYKVIKKSSPATAGNDKMVVTPSAAAADTDVVIQESSPATADNDKMVVTPSAAVAAADTDVVIRESSLALASNGKRVVTPSTTASDDDAGMVEPAPASADSNRLILESSQAAAGDDKITVTPSMTAAGDDKMVVTPSITAAGDDKMVVTHSVTAAGDDKMAVTPSVTAAVDVKMAVTPSVTAAGTDKMAVTPSGTAAGTDKMVVTPSGTAASTDEMVVTPSGTAAGADKMVVTPSGTAVGTDKMVVTPVAEMPRSDILASKALELAMDNKTEASELKESSSTQTLTQADHSAVTSSSRLTEQPQPDMSELKESSPTSRLTQADPSAVITSPHLTEQPQPTPEVSELKETTVNVSSQQAQAGQLADVQVQQAADKGMSAATSPALQEAEAQQAADKGVSAATSPALQEAEAQQAADMGTSAATWPALQEAEASQAADKGMDTATSPALQGAEAQQAADKDTGAATSPALQEAESILAKLQASVQNLKQRVVNDFERQEGAAKELEEKMSFAGKFWKRMTGGMMKPPDSK